MAAASTFSCSVITSSAAKTALAGASWVVSTLVETSRPVVASCSTRVGKGAADVNAEGVSLDWVGLAHAAVEILLRLDADGGMERLGDKQGAVSPGRGHGGPAGLGLRAAQHRGQAPEPRYPAVRPPS